MKKMFEVTVLSDHKKLEKYAPQKGRSSNRFILINEDKITAPTKYKQFFCYHNEKGCNVYGYRINIKGDLLYIHCQTKTIELDINPKDFAVRIMLPIESQFMSFELVSIQNLKENVAIEPQNPSESVVLDQECYDDLNDLEPVVEPLLRSTEPSLGIADEETSTIEEIVVPSIEDTVEKKEFKPISDDK